MSLGPAVVRIARMLRDSVSALQGRRSSRNARDGFKTNGRFNTLCFLSTPSFVVNGVHNSHERIHVEIFSM